MNRLCHKLKTASFELAREVFDGDTNIDFYGAKFGLTIYFYDGYLRKSKRYGEEVFIRLIDGYLIGHSNPGVLAKLPTGVNKMKGCLFKLSEILNRKCEDDCCLDTDWSAIEGKNRVGINIWRKTSTGLNKSIITNIRRSKIAPAIHLHCDNFFRKDYLITCKKLYFRGHKHLIN